jgi:hypothetical protein
MARLPILRELNHQELATILTALEPVAWPVERALEGDRFTNLALVVVGLGVGPDCPVATRSNLVSWAQEVMGLVYNFNGRRLRTLTYEDAIGGAQDRGLTRPVFELMYTCGGDQCVVMGSQMRLLPHASDSIWTKRVVQGSGFEYMYNGSVAVCACSLFKNSCKQVHRRPLVPLLPLHLLPAILQDLSDNESSGSEVFRHSGVYKNSNSLRMPSSSASGMIQVSKRRKLTIQGSCESSHSWEQASTSAGVGGSWSAVSSCESSDNEDME